MANDEKAISDLQKLGENVASALKATPVQCPFCNKEIYVRPAAFVPREQVFHMVLSSEHAMIAARTIGGVISEIDSLMVSIAKDYGAKVSTFIKSMKCTPNKIDIGFAIIRAREENSYEPATK